MIGGETLKNENDLVTAITRDYVLFRLNRNFEETDNLQFLSAKRQEESEEFPHIINRVCCHISQLCSVSAARADLYPFGPTGLHYDGDRRQEVT